MPQLPTPSQSSTWSLVRLTMGLLTASVVASGLLVGRLLSTGTPTFGFLGWNLVLAWIPLLLALAITGLHRARSSGVGLVLAGLVWLAFLPNAPYIVTDVVHLHARSPVFDIALVSVFALVGLAVGLASLLLVQHVVTDHLGALAGWTMSAAALVLSTVGIWLGRVHRFNSWDITAQAGALLDLAWHRFQHPLGNPDLIVAVVLGSAGLGLAYGLTWWLVASWIPADAC
ncbi:DUF1361 domain-containing protein [Aestuariimicrobium ganziense]|uniref:DUF1361 domain-containing protein n=1 Tax=Aestuariimicrobium ganziense TaxID=2773677 RepID=UPI001944D958|nr:DUF1361 domain-containing protein [Aestuariimicrobium ganziense]